MYDVVLLRHHLDQEPNNYSDQTRVSFNIVPTKLNNFLAPYSNFCKPLKIIQKFVLSTSSPRPHWPPLRTKMAIFYFVFQSKEQVVFRRGRIRRIGWVIKTLEAQLGHLLLGWMCSVRRSIFVQKRDHHGEIPASFFFQNIPQLYQQRWVIFRVDNLALWKIVDEEGHVLIPKFKARIFPANFSVGIFWGGPICSRSIDCCLHSVS